MFVIKNRNYIQTNCNDRRNTFHFACQHHHHHHQWNSITSFPISYNFI